MNYRLMVLSLCVTLFAACKPDDPEPDPVGGKGGNATLLITPYHHTKMIDSLTVYIKYNASDKPASYDDSAKCVPVSGKSVATFSGLKKGKYYLFGTGWDPGIMDTVIGGIPYTITDETTISLNLPVSEGD